MKKCALLLLVCTLSLNAARLRKELSVRYSAVSVVARLLSGGWLKDNDLMRRLGRKAGGWSDVEFARNDRVVILLPDKYVRPLHRFRILLAGWMRMNRASCPFVLIMYEGNPTLMYFKSSSGGRYNDAHSISVFVIPGRGRKKDILYLEREATKGVFNAYRRR